MSDDGSGKGAALIAIVADRFQRSQLQSISSFDENDEEEVRSNFQQRSSTTTALNSQPAVVTNTPIRTLP